MMEYYQMVKRFPIRLEFLLDNLLFVGNFQEDGYIDYLLKLRRL